MAKVLSGTPKHINQGGAERGGAVGRLAVNASGDAAATWFARLDPTGLDLVWIATNVLRP